MAYNLANVCLTISIRAPGIEAPIKPISSWYFPTWNAHPALTHFSMAPKPAIGNNNNNYTDKSWTATEMKWLPKKASRCNIWLCCRHFTHSRFLMQSPLLWLQQHQPGNEKLPPLPMKHTSFTAFPLVSGHINIFLRPQRSISNTKKKISKCKGLIFY